MKLHFTHASTATYTLGRCLVAAFMIAVFVSRPASTAHAASITVTTLADGGPGSLRQAISDAAAGDTITFASGLTGQILTLTGGELLIDKNLTITGPSENRVIINGDDQSRVLHIAWGVTAAISGLTIADGYSISGSGIYNEGTLTLERSHIAFNRTDGFGGGILNAGTLTLIDCVVGLNEARIGGGIFNAGTMLLRDSAVGSNLATTEGGGIFLQNYSTTEVVSSLISHNQAPAGGGMLNGFSHPVLTDVTFSNNRATKGGGIYNHASSPVLTNVTFSENSATDGGGMYTHSRYRDQSAPKLVNVTFTGNSATSKGGAMYNGADDPLRPSEPTVVNSILWGNSGGEIFNSDSTAQVTSSLVQGGCPTGATCVDSIDADPSFVDAAGGNLRLQGDSPAINAGSNADVSPGITTDLDGNPRIVGGIVDMGAFEYQLSNARPGVASISPSSVQAGSGDLQLVVSGSSFVPESTVRWNGTNLATDFASASELRATVPAGNLGTPTTAEVTVWTPGPGGGTSNLQPLFVTSTGAPVTSIGTGSSEEGTASANAGGTSGVTATATGTGTVVVAQYAANPAGTPGFNSADSYFDVYLSSGNSFSALTVVQCDTNGGTQAHWWTGTAWILASQQHYDPATGCITIIVNESTSPSLSDLHGTEFAVANVPPSVAAIAVTPTSPIAIGTAVNVTTSFSDPAGPADGPYAVAIDWGDGTPPASSTLAAPGAVDGSHTYTAPGIYTIKVTATDGHGGSDSATTSQDLVVYDPTGGFVTGEGWIAAPAGACKLPSCEENTSSKTSFAFVAKYQPGATLPTGQTEFTIKAGSLSFHSRDYQWLVVAGARAKYEGTGTINGSGNYRFTATAIDGQIDASRGKDTFRIQIWNTANGGSLVYDSQLGAPDGADPTTVLGGGSIVIHAR